MFLREIRALLQTLTMQFPPYELRRHNLTVSAGGPLGDLTLTFNLKGVRGQPLVVSCILEEKDMEQGVVAIYGELVNFIDEERLADARKNLLGTFEVLAHKKAEQEYRVRYPEIGSF